MENVPLWFLLGLLNALLASQDGNASYSERLFGAVVEKVIDGRATRCPFPLVPLLCLSPLADLGAFLEAMLIWRQRFRLHLQSLHLFSFAPCRLNSDWRWRWRG